MGINNATKLNNRGVAALQLGRCEEAVALFKDSFDIMMKSMSNARSSLDFDTPTKQTAVSWINIDQRDACVRKNGKLPSRNRARQAHPDSFVYSRALVMTSSSRTNSKLDAAIVLYNVAFALHLRGLKGGRGSFACLKRSLPIYKRAYNILQDVTDSPDSFHFHMAVVILNNVGQLHYELGQYSLSILFFKLLSKPLILVLPNRNCIDTEELHGMMLNIAILKEPRMAAAA